MIRFLRREDDTCDIRRQLGHAQILQKDLLPLVKQHHSDKPLFDTTIRYVVMLMNVLFCEVYFCSDFAFVSLLVLLLEFCHILYTCINLV